MPDFLYEWYGAATLLIGLLAVQLALGMPVALAFFATAGVGMFLYAGGWYGVQQIVMNSATGVAQFSFIPIPLFILMGELFFRSGRAEKLFSAVDAITGALPGRLAHLTVANGTLFAALSGTSMGNAALLGRLLVPEMQRRGYSATLSMGPILGAGGLAILIPPSSLAVLLGGIANLDIGAFLIASILPGLILAILFAGAIVIMVRMRPESAPAYAVDTALSGREKLVLIGREMLPAAFIVFLVIGSILLGIATPTEAAAFGALGVALLAAADGRLTLPALSSSLGQTARTSGMVLILVMGSLAFSQAMAVSGATGGIRDVVAGLSDSRLVLVLTLFGILLLLGAFMDQVSIMLITAPLFFPVIADAGFEPLWFGVIMLLSLEIAGVTPPFGLGLFVMKGVAPEGTRFGTIVCAALPFIACELALFALLLLLPDLALWLPGLM